MNALALPTIETFINNVWCYDALTFLHSLPAGSVNCCVTSPPYYGLRDYGVSGQIGLEDTPERFVASLVELFEAVRRVLRDDGVLWLNLGDSYAANRSTHDEQGGYGQDYTRNAGRSTRCKGVGNGIKPKDLIGIPWRVAFALQSAGWYLRSDIIWHKCLSGGARVYAKTQKGTMPMTVKDMVRLDPATVKLWNGKRWTQVVSWSETPRPANPIEIELRSGERVGCTDNHIWPTQRGNIRADELQIGDVIQACKLPCHPREEPAFIPPEMGWFVGLFMAEGSFGKDGSAIQIAGHTNELERYEKLQRIAGRYDGTCQKHDYGNQSTINIYSPVLVGIIQAYITGKGAKGKHLSSKCWMRGDDFLRHLLLGYLDGDGSWDADNNRWRIGFTRNYAWENDLRTLCARLGVHLRIKLSTATSQDGEFKAFRGEIRLEHSDHFNVKEDTEVVRIGRSRARKFWDISVEDDPHLFALASGVLTHNSNPMPESVTDRPTKAHEYVFLLTKSARYWYDADAVREGALQPIGETALTGQNTIKSQGIREQQNVSNNNGSGKSSLGTNQGASTRNRRSVWTVPTEAKPFQHFAMFPQALIEPMILAGCPGQVCTECGAPYVRDVERKANYTQRQDRDQPNGKAPQVDSSGWEPSTIIDNGYKSSCACNAETRPGVVLDPFMGSGTSGLVAQRLGRHFVGCDLNSDYVELARQRLQYHGDDKRMVTEQSAGVQQIDMFADNHATTKA